MTAIVLGATGATGSDLLKQLLNDEVFDRIIIFVRRKIDLLHPKLQIQEVNFDEPEHWKHLVKGDVLFSCLGTTLKTASSKAGQWKVDYEYQLAFAKAASENKVTHYVLVSAKLASSKSIFFYSKMKGKLEDAVRELTFQKLNIFNPPLLLRKNTDRTGEKIAYKIIHTLNKIGLLLSQKPLDTEELAREMVRVVKEI